MTACGLASRGNKGVAQTLEEAGRCFQQRFFWGGQRELPGWLRGFLILGLLFGGIF